MNRSNSSAIRRCKGAALAGAVVLVIAAGTSLKNVENASAQALSQAFGGFAASPDQPIDIQANRLDVDDNAKRAVFTGKVVARQDTFVMNSKTLEVRYAARSGAKKKDANSSGLGGGSTEVTHLTARGSVFIQSNKQAGQTAKGDWAEFDVKQRIITMGDNVTLKQGKNVIRGTRLVINLTTGLSSVQSKTTENTTTTGGRIRMLITPDKALRTGIEETRKPKKKQKRRVKDSSSQVQRSTRGDQ